MVRETLGKHAIVVGNSSRLPCPWAPWESKCRLQLRSGWQASAGDQVWPAQPPGPTRDRHTRLQRRQERWGQQQPSGSNHPIVQLDPIRRKRRDLVCISRCRSLQFLARPG